MGQKIVKLVIISQENLLSQLIFHSQGHTTDLVWGFLLLDCRHKIYHQHRMRKHTFLNTLQVTAEVHQSAHSTRVSVLVCQCKRSPHTWLDISAQHRILNTFFKSWNIYCSISFSLSLFLLVEIYIFFFTDHFIIIHFLIIIFIKCYEVLLKKMVLCLWCFTIISHCKLK